MNIQNNYNLCIISDKSTVYTIHGGENFRRMHGPSPPLPTYEEGKNKKRFNPPMESMIHYAVLDWNEDQR